jgi:DNA-directed RNA polymerase specialized sigma24 family protein
MAAQLSRGGWSIANREHFYAIVSISMRHVLIDLARQRLAAVRGSGQVTGSLEDQAVEIAAPERLEEIVQIGRLMEGLERKDRLMALIADMHYFAGYTFEEIGELTGLEVHQVGYRWKKAESWLKKQLG